QRWIEDFLQLEASGWKGQQGSALACTETSRRFASEVLSAAFHRGRLLGVEVAIEGRVIARCVSLLAREGAVAFKTAYDEAFAEFSPGVLMEIERIRAFHALEGVEWMDSFTSPGNERLERTWKDRLTIQRLLLGFGARGELAVALIPFLRWL